MAPLYLLALLAVGCCSLALLAVGCCSLDDFAGILSEGIGGLRYESLDRLAPTELRRCGVVVRALGNDVSTSAASFFAAISSYATDERG